VLAEEVERVLALVAAVQIQDVESLSPETLHPDTVQMMVGMALFAVGMTLFAVGMALLAEGMVLLAVEEVEYTTLVVVDMVSMVLRVVVDMVLDMSQDVVGKRR
jgi:hypothetical protein